MQKPVTYKVRYLEITIYLLTLICFSTGHSLGEMACAYHDDTFTAEELILSTYSRGMAVVVNKNMIKGSMAAVGVGYQAVRICLTFS